MPDVTFIILGATGDLTKRKLIPAIYHLLQKKKINHFALIGVARRAVKIEQILAEAKTFIKDLNPVVWRALQDHSYYSQLDFHDKQGYQGLQKEISQIERKENLPGKRLIYLATLPENFEIITQGFARSGIARKKWKRLVYEKPFGWNLSSARKIDEAIKRVDSERDIYRVDHYLGKELVENIALVRFTNRILEPLWNKNHIEQVQIILSEALGLEGRGEYYDRYGALKDVVQNHMLQMLALVAMESPRRLSGEDIRNEKVRVLRKTKIKDLLLGQFAGYRKESGVKPDSSTETFAVARLEVNNKRWRGVPFFLKTGKMLDKKETTIQIKFKKATCLLTRSCPSDSNYLTIRIEPNEGFTLELNAKVPGKHNLVMPVKMDFCHSCLFGPNTPEAYEELLEHALAGDRSFFIRADEIEESWRIVEAAKKGKMHEYDKRSAGPKELKEWNKKHHLKWKT